MAAQATKAKPESESGANSEPEAESSRDPLQEIFIGQLREQIDRLDDRLITLLRQRVGVARELGRLKQHYGLPLRDPVRERAVLARLARASVENGNNTLPGPAVEQIFNCIISATLQAEEDDVE